MNKHCPLGELIGFLSDLEGRLREHKCFQRECIKIRSLIRELQIYEIYEHFWSDRNEDSSNKPSISANSVKWIIRLAILAGLAEKVCQVVTRLFDG